ncbi:MAG: hypothetical protein ACE5R4_14875, partial [Armatimonadota bacterium]
WAVDELVGLLVNPDITQPLQLVIASNTAMTINVWGDVTSIADFLDDYQIWDYHVQSVVGRWVPNSWVTDDAMSPCIDQGDPASDYGNEPTPNGWCVNMGAYGNTDQASKGSDPTIVRPVHDRRSPQWFDWLDRLLNLGLSSAAG